MKVVTWKRDFERVVAPTPSRRHVSNCVVLVCSGTRVPWIPLFAHTYSTSARLQPPLIALVILPAADNLLTYNTAVMWAGLGLTLATNWASVAVANNASHVCNRENKRGNQLSKYRLFDLFIVTVAGAARNTDSYSHFVLYWVFILSMSCMYSTVSHLFPVSLPNKRDLSLLSVYFPSIPLFDIWFWLRNL